MDLKKVKKILAEVILASTSHGLPNIIRSDRIILKILWTISTLISAAICSYLIAENIMNYYQFEVITKIRVVEEVGCEFPTITVCNLNLITNAKGLDKFYEFNQSVNNEPANFYFQIELKFKINKSELNDYGDTKEKLINTLLMNFEYINFNTIIPYFHPEHGNCYKINSGFYQNGSQNPTIKSTRPGRLQGMTIILNTSLATEFKYLNLQNGGIVFIHNKTESPVTVEGVMLKPGTITSIGLTRTFSTKIPKPYSNCDGNTDKIENYDSSLYKLIFNVTGKYNRQLCIDQCYQFELLNKCKCIDLSFESYFDGIPCDYYDQCLYGLYVSFYSNLDNKCAKECPIECEKTSFTKTISVFDLGNNEWEKYYREYFNLNESNLVRDELTGVNIYYENLGYTEIRELESINVVTLLSNIGGIAGLFMGVSFLSFVESIDFVFQLILIFYDNRTKNKVTKF